METSVINTDERSAMILKGSMMKNVVRISRSRSEIKELMSNNKRWRIILMFFSRAKKLKISDKSGITKILKKNLTIKPKLIEQSRNYFLFLFRTSTFSFQVYDEVFDIRIIKNKETGNDFVILNVSLVYLHFLLFFLLEKTNTNLSNKS